MELAEVFFGRRNKAKEERDKFNPKDLLLQKYAHPEDDRDAAKPENQFEAKKKGHVVEDEMRANVRRKLNKAIHKMNYRYKPRADMPFWYDWEPKKFQT